MRRVSRALAAQWAAVQRPVLHLLEKGAEKDRFAVYLVLEALFFSGCGLGRFAPERQA